MRWKQALLSIIALTPLGCVETPMAAKPSDPPAAAQQPPPPPPATPKRAPSSPAPDDTDPVVTAAQLSGERVARYEERIDESLSAVAADLQTLSGTDFRAVDRTAEKLLAAVQQLRASGQRILERYPQVKADLASIVKASGGVKSGYGRAKELYLDKAKAETGELKSRYETLAELCDTFVRTNDARTATYAAFAKDLDKAVAKVEGHVQFLTDFETFLRLDPGVHGAQRRAEFTAELNAFAEHVLKLGDVLRTFRDKVRDGAVSKKLKAEHGKAVAAKLAEWDKLWAAVGRGPANAVAAPPARPDGKSDAAKATDHAAAEPVPSSVAPTAVGTPVPVPVAACPPAVRWVPVVVTRCVTTLVPVTVLHTQRGLLGRCRTVATTQYQCQTRPVTEVRYVAVRP